MHKKKLSTFNFSDYSRAFPEEQDLTARGLHDLFFDPSPALPYEQGRVFLQW
jgi:hypothetical protein